MNRRNPKLIGELTKGRVGMERDGREEATKWQRLWESMDDQRGKANWRVQGAKTKGMRLGTGEAMRIQSWQSEGCRIQRPKGGMLVRKTPWG